MKIVQVFVSVLLLAIGISGLFGFMRGAMQPQVPIPNWERAELEAWGHIFGPIGYIALVVVVLTITVAVLLFRSALGDGKEKPRDK